jgi:hypothetical protein
MNVISIALIRTIAAFAFLGALSIAPDSLSGQAAAATKPHPIVATWRFVGYQTWDAAGVASTPFGVIPSGYIVFDANGVAVVQLSTPVAPGDTARDVNFGAYYGRYTIDPRADTVRIKVEGANFSGYAGTTQVRPFRIAGDTLFLGVPREYLATLVRVRPGR